MKFSDIIRLVAFWLVTLVLAFKALEYLLVDALHLVDIMGRAFDVYWLASLGALLFSLLAVGAVLAIDSFLNG